MKPSLHFLIISTFLAIVSCKDADPYATSEASLVGCWIHSQVEQVHGDPLIYRPCDYQVEWPASRYTHSFILEENGEGSYWVLHPADAHYWTDCTWTFDDTNGILRLYLHEFQDDRLYKISQMDSDKLVLTNF